MQGRQKDEFSTDTCRDGQVNGWARHLNERLKVVYEDGQRQNGRSHYSSREGQLISFNDSHIVLLINNCEVGISKSKILRYEVLRGGSQWA